MGQWLFFVCFLVRFFRPRFAAAWLRESEPEGQEAACGFPYTTTSISTLRQHSRVRAVKPRQQLLFGRAALPGHRTLGAADAWKCSVSPSGIVCRRNPDPRLPAASRQSGKAGHQPILQGGTRWNGHRAQWGGGMGYPWLSAWTGERASLGLSHLVFFPPLSLTQRPDVSIPAPAQTDTPGCPCKLKGALCKDDVDAERC